MRADNLDHRQIEVFRAVMRSGSMTGAARLLEISQPGVSKIISQVERICGFALFERIHGRLMPSPRALSLFEETERMFVGLEQIGRVLDRLRADEPRQALIATVPVFAQELLPQVISRWLEVHRDTRLAVSARYGGGVLALVSSRRAELGLISTISRVPGVKSLTFARCKAMCAVPANHPLLDRDVIRPADLHGQPYISSSRYEGLQTAIDRVFKAENVRPLEIIECPLIVGAAAMAHAGIGLTFVDAFSARPYRSQGLALRRFEPTITFEYRAIWSDGIRGSFDRPSFLKLIRECAQEVIVQSETK